jgi:hypothetical protein
MYLFCNSKIHVITLYSGQVCVYYASILRCWHLVWILVRTDHPCLGVRCHTDRPCLKPVTTRPCSAPPPGKRVVPSSFVVPAAIPRHTFPAQVTVKPCRPSTFEAGRLTRPCLRSSVRCACRTAVAFPRAPCPLPSPGGGVHVEAPLPGAPLLLSAAASPAAV